MEPVALQLLLNLCDLAVDGHILKDVQPYLAELLRLRRMWQMRCFHPDCEEEMTGAHVAPVLLTYCPTHRIIAERINKLETESQVAPPGPKSSLRTMELRCPACGQQHIDEGEWAIRPHKTHRCVPCSTGKGCGHEWRPYDYPTTGCAPG